MKSDATTGSQPPAAGTSPSGSYSPAGTPPAASGAGSSFGSTVSGTTGSSTAGSGSTGFGSTGFGSSEPGAPGGYGAGAPQAGETTFGSPQQPGMSPPGTPSFGSVPAPPPETLYQGYAQPPAGVYQQSYGQYYGGPLPDAENDGKATTSLILGILSLTCLGILAGIPAIILGHMSRSNIARSQGRLKGDGKALAGLIMGYISVVMIPFILIIAAIAIPNLIRARIAANEASAVGSLRTVNTAQVTYAATYRNGYAPDLATLGGHANCNDADANHACLLDSMLGNVTCVGVVWCQKSGYMFILQADTVEPHRTYTVSAIPQVMFQTGNRAFCTTEDGLIRMDPSTTARTTAYTAEECKALPPP